MMKTMKRCLCLLPLAGALACAADLASVHSVYLLPMARGMDQYLANQLTNAHVFQVVTDPKLADAILTDHVTEGFQAQLEEFSPTPKPPVAEKKPDAEPAAKPDDKAAAPEKPAAPEPAAKADDEPKPVRQLRVQPRSRHGLPGGRQVAPGDLVDIRAS
jgi:outer membrane biosynthesis protein TonB